MKIAIACSKQHEISSHPGHCRQFAIYTIADDRSVQPPEWLELSGDATFHNSSVPIPPALEAIDVLLAGSMGVGLFQRLERHGIEPVITSEKDPEQALQAYLAGSLERGQPEERDEERPRQHRHRRSDDLLEGDRQPGFGRGQRAGDDRPSGLGRRAGCDRHRARHGRQCGRGQHQSGVGQLPSA